MSQIILHEHASRRVGLKRLLRKISLNLAKSQWFPSPVRCRLLSWGGVRIQQNCFVGEQVLVDTIRPDYISIGSNTTITARVCILSHFRKGEEQFLGHVNIGKNVFLGINTIIASPVSIGDYAIVGAGSIVTKDIPAGEVWAGNPARFIRKRDDVEI